MHHNNLIETRGVLATLRSVVPAREVTFAEAKRIAELQANRLLALFDITDGAVPSEIVSELSRVRIVYADLPVSGISHWSGTHWIITLNKGEFVGRQRFTLMHEFKHVIDHGRTHQLYTGDFRRTGGQQAELAADYFAACVLMPKRFLKAAWSYGIQSPLALASKFEVSPLAITVRLAQTGLSAVCDPDLPATVGRHLNRGRPLYQRQPAAQGG